MIRPLTGTIPTALAVALVQSFRFQTTDVSTLPEKRSELQLASYSTGWPTQLRHPPNCFRLGFGRERLRSLAIRHRRPSNIEGQAVSTTSRPLR